MPSTVSYQIYNLSNPHFQEVEIQTQDNQILKGQFVQFKVLKGVIEYIYPAEKYCFLPETHKQQFWKTVGLNDGIFHEFPSYIKQFGLNHLKKIIIMPHMLIG